jgi:hypothetical protein
MSGAKFIRKVFTFKPYQNYFKTALSRGAPAQRIPFFHMILGSDVGKGGSLNVLV